MIQTTTKHGPKLSDCAYHSLRRDIIEMKYAPGEIVFEPLLAESLGMSRTPVREALRLLREDGLVEILPQRGIRITKISIHKMKEVHQVRQMILREVYLAIADEKARSKAGYMEFICKCSENLTHMRDLLEGGSLVEFRKLDLEFHKLPVDFHANAYMSSIYDDVCMHLTRIWEYELMENNHLPIIYQTHCDMLNDILAGNTEHLCMLLDTHLNAYSFTRRIPEEYQSYFCE